jgi:hypothetical protein
MACLQNVVNAYDGEGCEDSAGDRKQPDMPRIVKRACREQDGDENAERQNYESRREGKHKRLHGTLDDQKISWSGIAQKSILATIAGSIAAMKVKQIIYGFPNNRTKRIARY